MDITPAALHGMHYQLCHVVWTLTAELEFVASPGVACLIQQRHPHAAGLVLGHLKSGWPGKPVEVNMHVKQPVGKWTPGPLAWHLHGPSAMVIPLTHLSPHSSSIPHLHVVHLHQRGLLWPAGVYG